MGAPHARRPHQLVIVVVAQVKKVVVVNERHSHLIQPTGPTKYVTFEVRHLGEVNDSGRLDTEAVDIKFVSEHLERSSRSIYLHRDPALNANSHYLGVFSLENAERSAGIDLSFQSSGFLSLEKSNFDLNSADCGSVLV